MMAQSNRVLKENMENRRSRRKRYTQHQEPQPQSFWPSVSIQISTKTLNRLTILCAGRSAKYLFDRQRDLAIFQNLPDPTELTCKECYENHAWANKLGGTTIEGGKLLESSRKPWAAYNNGLTLRYRHSAKGSLNGHPQPKFSDGSYSAAITSFTCPHVSPLVMRSAQPNPNTIHEALDLVDIPHTVTVQNAQPTENVSVSSSPSIVSSARSSPNTIYSPYIDSPLRFKDRLRVSHEQAQPQSSTTNNHTTLKSCLKTPDLYSNNGSRSPGKKSKRLEINNKVTMLVFVDYEPPAKIELTRKFTVQNRSPCSLERDTFGPKKLNPPSTRGVAVRKTANCRSVYNLDDLHPSLDKPKEWPSKHVRIRFDPRTSVACTSIPDLPYQPLARVPPERKLNSLRVEPYTRIPQFSEIWEPMEYIVTSTDPSNAGVNWLRANGLSRKVCLRPNDLSISSTYEKKRDIREKEKFMANTGVQAAGAVVARANKYQPPHGMHLYPEQIAALVRKPASFSSKPASPKQPVYRRPARPAGSSNARRAVPGRQAQGGRRTQVNAAKLQAETARRANEAYERCQAAKGKNIAPTMERSGQDQPTSHTVNTSEPNQAMLSREESEISLRSTLTDQELLRASTGARDFKDPESPPRRKKIGAPSSGDETSLPAIAEADEERESSPRVLIKTASMETIDSDSTAGRHDQSSSSVSQLSQSPHDADKTHPEIYLSGTTKADSRPSTQSAGGVDNYFEPQATHKPITIPSGPKLTMKDAVSATVSMTYNDPEQTRQMKRINDSTIEDNELNAESVPKAPTPELTPSFSGADSHDSSDEGRNRWDPNWIVEPNFADL